MDKKEFAARVELLKKRLYRTAYLYLGNETSALEAVDEAVYKGLRGLKNLRQPEYFDTWLTRILINECKQELNRRTRIYPTENLLMDKSEEFNYDALPLKEAINRLSEELRVVVIMRFFSGYTLVETAESLGIPQGTVATRQRRALALLKLELAEEELL
jgi:RNA polymerase sigma-70 factor (ECF subfamily)